MRIGIFTDTYRPSVNGIVTVTDILRRNFEALGHEVYVFAPAPGLSYQNDDPSLIYFPAVNAKVFDDYKASLFFPPKVTKRIEELELDIIHFLTPGPVGLIGIYAATKLGVPLVGEYCTDLFEYVDHYPLAMPAILALGTILPFTLKSSFEEFKAMVLATRPRLSVSRWNREAVKQIVTIVHGHCGAVIAHSRKSELQLKEWQNGDRIYPVYMIPTGVDPLPPASQAALTSFKQQWHIRPDDEIVTYVGRLSSEKNLDMLIDMTCELAKWRPQAKMMFVGDFDYREILEQKAAASSAPDHFIFTGRMPRDDLGVPLAASKVFVFPSLTDTQGLVLHEATGAGKPVVLVDEAVTEVVRDGKNGFVCEDSPIDMAAKVCMILEDPTLQAGMARASRQIAAKYSERAQCLEIIEVYKSLSSQPMPIARTAQN